MPKDFRGYADSRPDPAKPAPGRLDGSMKPYKSKRGPDSNVSSFGNKGNEGKVNWKGDAGQWPPGKGNSGKGY